LFSRRNLARIAQQIRGMHPHYRKLIPQGAKQVLDADQLLIATLPFALPPLQDLREEGDEELLNAASDETVQAKIRCVSGKGTIVDPNQGRAALGQIS
jgi:hypothetical protein